MKLRNISWLFLLLAVLFVSCQRKAATIVRPSFSADSAYQYICDQMAFGPRIPNTDEHNRCAVYLMQQARRFGGRVEMQKGMMLDYAGQMQTVYNIIVHCNTQAAGKTVILCAHYDTRPWCDREEEYENRLSPVPGANDGASGVGVLLEVMRQIQILSQDSTRHLPPVDIIFFDVEDMGTPTHYTGVERENTWCLGSQYWAKELSDQHSKQYQYGILLDMVGAPDVVFPKEMHSTRYAGNYLEKVWRKARQLGYGQYFVENMAYPIVDDHYYVSVYGGVPCLDIIHYDARTQSGFPDWWHTQNDDLTNIHKPTLQMVGEVVLATLLD